MAILNNDPSKLYFGLANEMSSSKEQKMCNDCGQPIRPRCTACHQFIRETSTDAEFCEGCGQEILSDEETEVTVQQGGGKERGFKWTKCDNGVYRAKCLGCKRKTEECPRCQVIYDVAEDDYSTESNSSESASTETEISETETDSDEKLSEESKPSGAKHFSEHRKRRKITGNKYK